MVHHNYFLFSTAKVVHQNYWNHFKAHIKLEKNEIESKCFLVDCWMGSVSINNSLCSQTKTKTWNWSFKAKQGIFIYSCVLWTGELKSLFISGILKGYFQSTLKLKIGVLWMFLPSYLVICNIISISLLRKLCHERFSVTPAKVLKVWL